MTPRTVCVLLEPGIEALHRVTSVMAHQRAVVRSLALDAAPAHPGLALLTLELEARPDMLDQLVKRLRRAQCVHAVETSG